MPRIGLAWSPGTSGTTSIRAGFAMGYDVLYDNIGILALPPQLSGTIDFPFTPVTSGFLANGGILPGKGGLQTFASVPAQRAATSAYIPVNMQYPTAIDWDLGVQHSFGSNYTVELRYLGTRGYHLDVQDRVNRQAIVTPSLFLPTYLTAPTQAALNALPHVLGGNGTPGVNGLADMSSYVPAYANAGFDGANIVQDSPWGNSIYHGLAFQLTRRFNHGLSINGAWTWSHVEDNSTADFFTTLLTPRRPQDFQNVNADWSTSSLDHRHRISITMLYDMPYFKSGSWMRRNLMGNWVLAPVYTYQSGGMFDVQSQNDANLNGDAAGDRTIINPAGNSAIGSDVTALCKSTLPAAATCDPSDPVGSDYVVAYLANNPKARYIVAGPGALATSGRNTEQGRPIQDVDMSIGKNFNISERFKNEFQAQFTNFLNHPQFIPGFINRIDDNNASQVAKIYTGGAVNNYVFPGSGTFDQAAATFPSNARIITLVLKLDF
jgi:hypothetical protein